ncbi:MAG: glycosyltransferase [Planctomycetota bacterium]
MSGAASVAVIVPVHNGARFLAATLAAVRAQTLPPDELWVVDDGSQDDSAEIAAEAGARVLRQANAGPGAARNRALAATNCEFVAFLDADDLFLPDKLARQVQVLRAAPAALAVCGDAWTLGGPRDGERRHAGRPIEPRLHLVDLLRQNPVITSSVLARRAAVVQVGGFDEAPVLIATEDYDLWLRMLGLPGGHFLYLAEPLLRYRVHDQALSGSGRFVAGLDRIAEKLAAVHTQSADVAAGMRARRVEARLDAAWDCLQRGERAGARAWLAQARSLGGRSRKAAKLWLRSWL